jgi:hypothetical protein
MTETPRGTSLSLKQIRATAGLVLGLIEVERTDLDRDRLRRAGNAGSAPVGENPI